MALPRETDPVALRDAAIFEAIDELFKSENYEKLVHELGYQFREEYNSSSWLANWNSIKAMNPLYDEFLEILGTSHENGRYQPLLDFGE
jgi:hypothetical protein